MKTTLITGAATGLGREFTRQLASRSDVIVAVDLREEPLRQLQGELEAVTKVVPVVADLATESGAAVAIAAAEPLGPIDMLVNNAGFITTEPYAEADLEVQLRMARLHMETPMRLCSFVLPEMKRSNRGAIINVASMTSFGPLPGSATYAASKAFLSSFTRSLARELAGTALHVQCLLPGWTRTSLFEREGVDFDASAIPDELWSEPATVVRKCLESYESTSFLVPEALDRKLARDGLNRLIQELRKPPLPKLD